MFNQQMIDDVKGLHDEDKDAQKKSELKQGFKPDSKEKLIAKSIIKINDIYLRIEDPKCKISVGVIIPSITIDPTDEKWNKYDQKDHPQPDSISNTHFKELEISNINVFLNTAAHFMEIDRELKLAKARGSNLLGEDQHKITDRIMLFMHKQPAFKKVPSNEIKKRPDFKAL